MRGWALVAACLMACGEDGGSGGVDAAGDGGANDSAADVQTTDAGDSAVADAAPGCSVELQAAEAVVAGGRLSLSYTFEGDVEGWAFSGPEGWRGEPAEGAIIARAGTAVGAATLTLSGTCANGESVEAEVEVDVKPLRWTPLPGWTADTGPLEREYFSMWMDQLEPDRLWVFGGFHYRPEQFTVAWDMWSYDLGSETWTEERSVGEPPHLAGGGLAKIPGEAAAYHYGGLGNNQLPFSLYRVEYAERPTWRAVTVEDEPDNGTYQPAFFHDSGRDRYLAIGGQGAGATHMNIAVFDPEASTWTAIEPAAGPAPTGRTGFFWTYDPETERFVAFAGEQGGAEGGACNCAQDTWALELSDDPPRWVELAGPQDPPIGRRNGAYALDPLGHRLLVWGGTPDGAMTFPGLYALDLDRGHEGWTLLATEDSPPIRTSGGAVFDGARGRMLAGFGNGAAIYADLWALQLAP